MWSMPGYPYRDEMTAMMTLYPQLYADVSTITWVIPRTAFYDYLQALVRAGLGRRLMFGSDQMRWPEKITVGIDAVQQAPFLTAEQNEGRPLQQRGTLPSAGRGVFKKLRGRHDQRV